MKSLLAICGAMAGLALISPVQAACTQANISGTWMVTGMAHLSNGGIGWNSCKLVISGAGKFAAAASGCTRSDNLSSSVSGTLKLANGSQCAYDGTLTFTKFGTTRYLRLATLSLDHQVVSGVVGGGSYGPARCA